MKDHFTHIDRRAVIKGATLTAAAAAIPAVAIAQAAQGEPSPELVALANELAAVVGRFNNSLEDGPSALSEASDRIWDEIEAFAPRSIADVLAKCHAGGIYRGEGIPEEGDELTAHGRILLLMLSDLERLTA